VTRSALPARGLYAITDSALHTGAALEHAVGRAIEGGAKVIQYRDKSGDGDRRHAEAERLVRLCRRHGVPMIVNDDVELALRAGADGVHIGRDDAALSAARARLGDGFIICVSCYGDGERALLAQRFGADYVSFGAMFPSATKPNATPAEIATITAFRGQIRVPIVAIGGITPENGVSLLEAGVDMLAVVRGVFGCDDPAVAAARYRQIFDQTLQDEKA
jgi:thiamine-phosphate pyrophosphorylase